MLGPNAEQVRMLLELEAGEYESAAVSVLKRNLSGGLVVNLADGSIGITGLGRQTLDRLRSGEFAAYWLCGKKVYSYTAAWRTEYPRVQWDAVVKRGRGLQAGRGGSFACGDLSQIPGAVRDLVETSIRDLAGSESRDA